MPAIQRVLIAGASIAGPALSLWLKRYGVAHCTIVERFVDRHGGAVIDVKGAGREVVRRLGLFDAIQAASTHEAGIRMTDGDLRVKAEFEVSANGPTAELEILRGDFAKVLIDAARERGVELIYGDYIVALDERPDKIVVTFNSGLVRDFDIVVAADGFSSKTRSLVFPSSEVGMPMLKVFTGWYAIPRISSDTNWARWTNPPGGRHIMLKPDRTGETMRVGLSFATDETYGRMTMDEHKALLRKHFEGSCKDADRLLDGMDKSTDLYGGPIGQVKAKHWSRGRVVLVGDAACCASPFSGQGTCISLIGTYLLAGELAAHDFDHRRGFESYEQRFRPYAVKSQGEPGFIIRLMVPRTQLGLSLVWLCARVVAFFTRWTPSWMSSHKDDYRSDFDLPDYSAYEVLADKPL